MMQKRINLKMVDKVYGPKVTDKDNDSYTIEEPEESDPYSNKHK